MINNVRCYGLSEIVRLTVHSTFTTPYKQQIKQLKYPELNLRVFWFIFSNKYIHLYFFLS